MKTFKNFITEDEELTQKYVTSILKKEYGFAWLGVNHAYTLENNSLITYEDITIEKNKNKKLPIAIKKCKRFTISDSNITSTYGFPKNCDGIYMKECNDIIIADFRNTSQNTLYIEHCSDIKIIRKINSADLHYIYFKNLFALDTLEINKCSQTANVILDCWSIKLSDVKIGNKIDTLNFYRCPNFTNFSGCTIAAENAKFGCQYLKTFDGFDTLHTDSIILESVNSEAKSVSLIITSPNIITELTFHWATPQKHLNTKKMCDIIFRYVYKNDKAERIMDFTLEMIDAGFEDQL